MPQIVEMQIINFEFLAGALKRRACRLVMMRENFANATYNNSLLQQNLPCIIAGQDQNRDALIVAIFLASHVSSRNQ